MLMASAEVDADSDPGNGNWRTAPVNNLPTPHASRARASAAAPAGADFAIPSRIVDAAPHFLGGSWDDSKVAKDRFKRLADSPWKVVDMETTGRTP